MEKELTNQNLLLKIEELKEKADRYYKYWQDEEVKTKNLTEKLEKAERHINVLLDLLSKIF